MSTARGIVPTDATPMEVCYHEDAKPTGAAHERRRVLPPARGNGARNAKGSPLRLQRVLQSWTGFMHARAPVREAIHLLHTYVFARTTAKTRLVHHSEAPHARKPTVYVFVVVKTQHHVQAVLKSLHCDAHEFRRPPRRRTRRATPTAGRTRSTIGKRRGRRA